jgi:hypothetical protein
MNNEAKFWKAEYERLRRNKNKEIQRTREQISIFFDKTWNLLHELGMKDEEIREYYGSRTDVSPMRNQG